MSAPFAPFAVIPLRTFRSSCSSISSSSSASPHSVSACAPSRTPSRRSSAPSASSSPPSSSAGASAATGIVGLVCALSWLLLPWLEILTRVRKLTLPLEKNLRHKHAAEHRPPFPPSTRLTDEIEAEGFEHVEDAGWDWEDYQQFFRLFYKPADRAQAAICLIDQHERRLLLPQRLLAREKRHKSGRLGTTPSPTA